MFNMLYKVTVNSFKKLSGRLLEPAEVKNLKWKKGESVLLSWQSVNFNILKYS
jgi:hypothetical protein